MENKVSLKSLYFSFFKVGLFTFGGGIAMLPLLEKEIVDKNKWCTLEELMDYYAVGQCTPGIIAVNTATFIGYKHRGIIGGIIATLGMVSPSLIIISLIATLINNFADLPLVKATLKGLGAGVCAILIPSIIKLAKKSLINIFTLIIAMAAFLALWLSELPVYLLVIGSIAISLIGGVKQ